MSPSDWDAVTYDRLAAPMTRWGRTVVDRLDLHGDERVLDAGCGRGYATLDENLEIDFRLNGKVMGAILPPGGASYTASVHVEDPDGTPEDTITLVEVISDHGEVVASRPTSGTDVSVTFALTSTTSRYYYVRVTTDSDVTGGARRDGVDGARMDGPVGDVNGSSLLR